LTGVIHAGRVPEPLSRSQLATIWRLAVSK
jgi:hypothetical protein